MMEETKRRKTESIVFAALLFAVSALLVYVGGIKEGLKIATAVLPVFGAALIIFSFDQFFVKLGALVLLWIPQILVWKTGDYAALFFPVVSLVFAASNLDPARFRKKAAAASLSIAAVVPFACIIYNATQYSLRAYFGGRWNKMIVLLVLFLLLFLSLLGMKIKVNKYKTDEKTILTDSRILFAVAIFDILLGIETLFQFMWDVFTIHHLYCLAWVLFFVGIIRYQTPQAARIMKKLKSD